METFTLDPRCWWTARILGRNPLIRRTDRIEALVMLIVFVVSLLAVPVAGVAGALTYHARDRLYAQEALERHRVTAVVTEAVTEDWGMTVVQANWPVGKGERVGTLELTDPAKAGDHVEVWLDRQGNQSLPPTARWSAVAEAFCTTILVLLAAAVTLVALAVAIRSRLDRARDAAWEHDIECLAIYGG